jgi:hypothetical protein
MIVKGGVCTTGCDDRVIKVQGSRSSWGRQEFKSEGRQEFKISETESADLGRKCSLFCFQFSVVVSSL